MTPKKHPGGRPPMPYDPKVGTEICEIIAVTDWSLQRICNSGENFPSLTTVMKWLRESLEFAQEYAHAKRLQADYLFDLAAEIAAEEPMNKHGVDSGGIARNRLRWDDIRWRIGKLNPKKYGDKLDVEHSGGVILQHAIPRPVRE